MAYEKDFLVIDEYNNNVFFRIFIYTHWPVYFETISTGQYIVEYYGTHPVKCSTPDKHFPTTIFYLCR